MSYEIVSKEELHAKIEKVEPVKQLSPYVLEIDHISVCFDGFYALTDVHTKVKRNDIHFFIGPNGAGKTTLLDIICSKTKPTSGCVVFHPMYNDPVILTGMKEYKIVWLGIGRKFQVPSVFINLLFPSSSLRSINFAIYLAHINPPQKSEKHH